MNILLSSFRRQDKLTECGAAYLVIITLIWQELASFIQRKANQNLSNSGDNKDNIIQAVKHGDENLVRKLLEEDSGKIRADLSSPNVWALQN